MNYTLYLTQASDDRTTVYSYALHNYEGPQASEYSLRPEDVGRTRHTAAILRFSGL